MNRIIIALVIYITSVVLSGWYFYGVGRDKEAKKFSEYREAQKALVLQLQKDNQDKIVSLQKDKENAIKNLNKRHASIIDSLRQRPERPSITTPQAPSIASVCTGAGSSGDRLYREDAEFLIGEAARAETLRQALKACRAQLESTNN